jgi:hypothetical protein
MDSIASTFRGSARLIFQELGTVISQRDAGALSQEQFVKKLSSLMMGLPRLNVSSADNDDGDAFEAVLDADGRLRVQTLDTRSTPSLSPTGAKRLRDFIEALYV